MPPSLISGLLQGFLAPPCVDADLHRATLRAAGDYLRATRLPSLQDSEILLGDGSCPCFQIHCALSRMLKLPPTVRLPRGSYGMFPPLLRAAGCEVRLMVMDTQAPDFVLGRRLWIRCAAACAAAGTSWRRDFGNWASAGLAEPPDGPLRRNSTCCKAALNFLSSGGPHDKERGLLTAEH